MVTRYNVLKLVEQGKTDTTICRALQISTGSLAAYKAHLTRNDEWHQADPLQPYINGSGRFIVIPVEKARRLDQSKTRQLVEILAEVDVEIPEKIDVSYVHGRTRSENHKASLERIRRRVLSLIKKGETPEEIYTRFPESQLGTVRAIRAHYTMGHYD